MWLEIGKGLSGIALGTLLAVIMASKIHASGNILEEDQEKEIEDILINKIVEESIIYLSEL